MPDWYPVVAAARWAGVAPWELAERPGWCAVLLAAMGAEGHAREQARR